ncbi:uncharacterized protein PGTG_06950 [Puccinia graminis f. sp. tritici CRL 75-36-700-3]|uniref:TAFII28-like protein domain-containing protein n=1 Tax=Puccinia graminis f. sp. tritici (strain CRL 75-36-700-3 / race SCCL) TaxID=418459 RepID=E3KAK5_PUCGT|nr:uncharacterized protein PGTG_06950 [Puccinia graminis f. sp. tritici CRL 75-36-700-3]EFP81329.2 hypothetical protein PGTG_06950 [Puccinia graminis f. sp. tritici CRL 75-36-700-3]
MTNKRPAYNHYPTNETAGHTSSPGFSPAPETPISTTGYYSPLNPSHPLILPTIPQRRKSKPNTTATNPNKRRKSSNVLKDQHHREDGFDHHHHHHQYEAGTSPAYQQNQADQQHKEDAELENEQEEEDNRKELNDDDYTVRKREDLLNKDKLKILLEHFDAQQMDRYSEYRNSGLAKANVRKLANTILQQSVTDRVTIVIRGFAKVFVGHMVEQALEVQKRRGGSGPITQYDLKEAYRAYLSERDRGGSDRRKMFTK